MKRLHGIRVLYLIDHGFRDLEVWQLRLRLSALGASVTIGAPTIATVYQSEHGRSIEAHAAIRELDAADFHALILPGCTSMEGLRGDHRVIELVRSFDRAGKVIGFIDHGAILAIEAGLVRDRHCTSTAGLKESMIDAGAIWTDTAVVCDDAIVSGRGLADAAAFTERFIEAISARTSNPRTNRSAAG